MIINRGYSRKFELEADQLGEEYLDRLDYDPNAMSAFLKTLKYSDELETKIAKIEGREPNIGYHGVFSTHPDHEKRIKALDKTDKKNNEMKIGKEKFLKLLDGSLYGSSPDEGYVKDSVFYHPVLAIKFNIDERWNFKNYPDKLELTKTDANMTLRADDLLADDLENGLTAEKYLSNGINKSSFLSSNELIESKDFSYNDLKGHSHLYINESIVGKSYKRFTVIFDTINSNTKPKAWIAVTSFKNLSDDKEVKSILKSFSKMSQDEIKKSKGLRIKVIRFRSGMTYEKLAASSPLGKYALDKLRLLNGHYPDDNPVVGDLIKIVE
jgi:predicted Zn-dependent protease